MGYCHYWEVKSQERWRDAWPSLIEDIDGIIQARHRKYGLSQNSHAALTGIYINGKDGMEDFELTVDGESQSWCKTDRKPYDTIVGVILLRAHQLLGNAIRISSDGDWKDDWLDSRLLYAEFWSDTAKCPWPQRKQASETHMARLELLRLHNSLLVHEKPPSYEWIAAKKA